MNIKQCEICGDEFIKHTYNQKYCSQACYSEALRRQSAERSRKRKKEKTPKESKKCEVCGKSFTPYRSNQKYCSKECQQKMQNIKSAERHRRLRTKATGNPVRRCAQRHLICFECPYKDCMYD